MLDIKFIRENPEEVKQNVINRRFDPVKANVDKLLLLDSRKVELEREIEKVREAQNKLAEKLKDASMRTPEMIDEGRKLKDGVKVLEEELATIQLDWQKIMDWIPNMMSADSPIGEGEAQDLEVKAWIKSEGYLPKSKLGFAGDSGKFMPLHDFAYRDHLELGKMHGIIDVEQSALVSGSRFSYLLGDAVLLQYALFDLLKNKLLSEGFKPMVVPLMVKERALYGSAHFPGDSDQIYKIENKYVEDQNDLYLVGSSEPPLFSYYMDKTVDVKQLPSKFFAFTTCFRSEVGSWGKDVRGIKRVHQFDKLEMDLICEQEKSSEMHEYLLSINEWFLQQLGLPYHVILMSSGDAGYAATHKKYDIEVWLPSQKTYMEVMSDTNARDFQARRFNTRYVDSDGIKKYVHNVNDTGCAMGRMLISILDNYQNEDGSITIPEVLRDYIGKNIITPSSD